MRLNQVTASARDLAASIAFYEALGLELIVRSEDYARFSCRDEEAAGAPSTFSLHRDARAKGVAETVVYLEEDGDRASDGPAA